MAEDQLEQSREDAERRSRDQAMRVTYWVDGGMGEPTRLHLMNRSLDPVSGVYLRFRAQDDSGLLLDLRDEGNSGSNSIVSFFLFMETVSPCTEITIDAESLRYGNKRKKFPRPGQVLLSGHKVRFWDRDGAVWERTTMRLQRLKGAEVDSANWLFEDDRYVPGDIAGTPVRKKAASCGEPAG
ncbi:MULTISPECIES: hypothetical protein [Streptomyces]|uniref:hypothetical protein n=1 Tax=Streptomyces TaxID=1883 RepID=UPI0013C3E666|nr:MULTISPECIES: hypothetical protein [Streptomyces]MDX3065814.1 hypothetical protein [Streptomyces sp. ND04-05B]MDX3519688.1 hypothetical protein [Streptomyces scabiei]